MNRFTMQQWWIRNGHTHFKPQFCHVRLPLVIRKFLALIRKDDTA